MTSPGASGQLRIGFLPFYVDYYEHVHSALPREKLALAKRCSKALSEFGEVIWDSRLISTAHSARSVGTRLAEQDIDCVVVLATIAVFGGIAWEALQHLDLPLLVWNVQQVRNVGDQFSMADVVRNTGQIGSQAISNVLLRKGRRYWVSNGFEVTKRAQSDLGRFFRLAETIAAIRKARLLNIGGPFPGMADIEIDQTALARNLGTRVINVKAETLYRACDRVSDSTVALHEKRLRKTQRIHSITPEEITRSIRLCEALSLLVEKHRADGGTLNCHSACLRNPEVGISACYSLGMQNAAGRPFSCTGDIPTALAMLLLKKLSGAGMYTEVQFMDEQRRAVVITNNGEGEDGLRRNRCKSTVVGNASYVGAHGRGASFAYPLEPGPATIVSLTPTPQGRKPYRLIVAEGHILEDQLPSAGSVAGFFRFSWGEMSAAYSRWIQAGPVHHAATAPGHWADELAAVSDVLNIECCTI